jgi:hypothetical protein
VKPQELANVCAKSISEATLLGLPVENVTALLVIPKGFKPPPKFPRGRTVQWKEDGSRVCYFNAVNLLAWLVGNGLAQVEVRTVAGVTAETTEAN